MEWIKENWVYITFVIGLIGGVIYYFWKFLTDRKFKEIDFTSKALGDKVNKDTTLIDNFIKDYRVLKKSLESLFNEYSFDYLKKELIEQKNNLEDSCSYLLLFLAEADNKTTNIDNIPSSKFIHEAKNKLVKLLNDLLLHNNKYSKEIRNQRIAELKEVNLQETKIREFLGQLKSTLVENYSKKI